METTNQNYFIYILWTPSNKSVFGYFTTKPAMIAYYQTKHELVFKKLEKKPYETMERIEINPSIPTTSIYYSKKRIHSPIYKRYFYVAELWQTQSSYSELVINHMHLHYQNALTECIEWIKEESDDLEDEHDLDFSEYDIKSKSTSTPFTQSHLFKLKHIQSILASHSYYELQYPTCEETSIIIYKVPLLEEFL